MMKARVQYNDLTGTAAADVSDFVNNNLQHYLSSRFKEFNSERYRCEGCTLYVSGQNRNPSIDIRFICYDKDGKKYVYLCPLEDMSNDEILSLFKRFEIVIGKDVNDVDISDDDWVDLK